MVLIVLAALLHTVMYLWMIVAAFTRSIGWGIAILLFSPITTIIYGLINFHEVKLPFILFLLTLVLFIASFFMVSDAEWEALAERASMQQQFDLEMPDDQSSEQSPPAMPLVTPVTPPPAPVATDTTPAPAVAPVTTAPVVPPTSPTAPTVTPATGPSATTPPAAPGTAKGEFPATNKDAQVDPLQVKRPEAKPATEKIKPAQVKNYMKKYLIVTMNNKVIRCGLLKKVDNKNIYLERKYEAKADTAEFVVTRSNIKTIEVLLDVTKAYPCGN